jgi:hypothetical protein
VPSSRDYPQRLVRWDYAQDWQKRKVSAGGQIRWKGGRVQISHALVDQTIGLKPIGEGLWTVYFQNLELGQWDERRGRLSHVQALRYAANAEEECE